MLITAKRTYYQFQRVPEFWDWLIECAGRNEVKIPVEMYEEIDKGDDELTEWLRRRIHPNIMRPATLYVREPRCAERRVRSRQHRGHRVGS